MVFQNGVANWLLSGALPMKELSDSQRNADDGSQIDPCCIIYRLMYLKQVAAHLVFVHIEYSSVLISCLLTGYTQVTWWALPSPRMGSSCTALTLRALWPFTTPQRKAMA